MAKILEGKSARDEIALRLKAEVSGFSMKPTLSIIQIGDTKESGVYIRQKKLFADKIGVDVSHLQFSTDISKDDLINEIEKLNNDSLVHGIIVQLPIPKNLNEQEIIETINPLKDVDGLTSINCKLLESNSGTGLIPATARGIESLLDYYHIDPSGKNIVVVGRSKLVGKPTAQVLQNRKAKVTVAHSQTENIKEVTKQADILVVAIGKPKFIDSSYVREGQVVIDVGINVDNSKLLDEQNDVEKKNTFCGDVDFENVKDIVFAISPVPGGVGLMTVASLFENLVEAYQRAKSEEDTELSKANV
jgi:methylenetetrahydrofolate dehydrogenase (NADP+)/methenyltetrahydrofolate cyclohydrolase